MHIMAQKVDHISSSFVETFKDEHANDVKANIRQYIKV